MKNTVFGISMLVLAGMAGQALAQEQVEQTPDATPSQAQPGSIEKIKEKIDAMNSHSTPGLEGVVKMYQAGVDKGVIETYIKNSRLTSPTPRDLIYLHDQGIPQELVNALIERGRVVDEDIAEHTAATPTATVDPSSGNTYNSYVYSPGTTPYSGYDYTSYANNNNNLLIIPYNPYRSYGSYYSPPFYSWGGYDWPYSTWAWNNWYYGDPLILPYAPRARFGFGGHFDGPRFGGPIFSGGARFGGPRFGGPGPGGFAGGGHRFSGGGPGGPGPGRGPGGPGPGGPGGGFRR